MKNSMTLFLQLLTILLIVLKITGHSDITWLMCVTPVLLPTMFAFLALIASLFLLDGTDD